MSNAEPDREPRSWKTNDELNAVAAAAEAHHILGSFLSRSGTRLAVVKAREFDLDGPMDATDSAMAIYGYTQRIRLTAFGEDDLQTYAVWELYSRPRDMELRSKAVDVDCNHWRQGIASGMRKVLENLGHTIIPSGSATAAGTAFTKSWSRNDSDAS